MSVAKTARIEQGMTWVTSAPSASDLAKTGYAVFDFARLVKDYIGPVERIGLQRKTLETAAAALLGLFTQYPAVAILNVRVDKLGDLQRVYGFIVEPAYRRNCALLIHANVELDQLKPESFVDPLFGYAWTLQRLNHLATRYRRRSIDASLPPMTPIEELLFKAMKGAGLSPRAQYGIDPYRVDFAFPERLLAVEADGRAWHDAERDRARDQRLKERGWRVERFSGARILREASLCAQEVLGLYQSLPEVPEYSALELIDPKLSLWQRFVHWLRSLFHGDDGTADAGETEPAAVSEELRPRKWLESLDPGQRAAVTAHEGVAQVLAPAGSGKTRVLVARVQELISQGVPEHRILCTTFNRASQQDLEKRLKQVGADDVTVRSFHSLGRHILDEEKLLRAEIGILSYNQWRRFSTIAKNEEEGWVWIDAPEASEAVSNYKLVDMIRPAEAARRALTPFQKTAARIYELYEAALAELDRLDFDDLILNAVRLLQADAAARRRWQEKWECVLVDEYQDIELAQELLVQLLAAPEDCLMVVGDEDQCIYTWRRAEVERIINLDKRYPGLERSILGTCYRCPAEVVTASSQLIQHNRNRFPKNTGADPRRNDLPTPIVLTAMDDYKTGAEKIAESLRGCSPAETTILARTTRLLRIVALACVSAGIPFKANPRVLRPAESEQVLLAYLRLLASPTKAIADDVNQVFRIPNRYLPNGEEETVARRLRAGSSFSDAVSHIGHEEWRRKSLVVGGALLDRLSGEHEAQKVIVGLRTEGGLDQYFSNQERMSAQDQIEIEMLDTLETDSTGKSLDDMVQFLAQRKELLSAAQSEDGVELATIHGAKGREWDKVVVFGCDDDQLPHIRVLENPQRQPEKTTEPAPIEKTLEDERRLAYVAMTRARKVLELVYTAKNPSRFLVEAGLLDPRPRAPITAQPSGERNLAAEIPVYGHSTRSGAEYSPSGSVGTRYQATGRPFPAARIGRCPACSGPIAVGAPICGAMLNGRKVWIHERCATR